LLDAGHTVLVHCRHGKSRSPHIVAECIARRNGTDYFQEYAKVKKLRPEVLAYSIGQELREKKKRA
jgi:protein-tyrosine phosphatase